MDFYTLDNFNFKGKRVLLRVDINSPIKNNKVMPNARLTENSKTIKELINKKAKLTIIAHQGRLNGKDYLSLKQHSKILSKLTKENIQYIDDLIGNKAINKIKSLKEGEAILLKNTHSLKEDNIYNITKKQAYNSKLVKKLQPLFDYFINDAFSSSHRSEISIIGFNKIPNIAGRVMEKELKNIHNIHKKAKHPYIFFMGGLKIEDSFHLINNLLKQKKVDKILITGLFGILALIDKYQIDKKELIKNPKLKKTYKKVKYFLNKYPDKFELPIDIAFIDKNKRKEIVINPITIDSILVYDLNIDIGKRTIDHYKQILSKAKMIYIKGPPGAYENKLLEKGTKEILKTISNSKAYSLAGGGHTSQAIDKFIKKNKFSYISLAGGALIDYLAGEKLPGVESLSKCST
ncbi:MAG: phosphoglycerate kinase [Nanoarchaeota archaeon]|nr:phosphoglycerate kinase [Nanoarchaeota archaeon]